MKPGRSEGRRVAILAHGASGSRSSLALAVGVGDADAVERAPFERLHGLRLALHLMIVADKMQKSVRDHMGEMIGERLVLRARLGLDRLEGDGHVADRAGETGRRGKRQHVRRLVLTAPARVEIADRRIVAEKQAHLGLRRG